MVPNDILNDPKWYSNTLKTLLRYIIPLFFFIVFFFGTLFNYLYLLIRSSDTLTLLFYMPIQLRPVFYTVISTVYFYFHKLIKSIYINYNQHYTKPKCIPINLLIISFDNMPFKYICKHKQNKDTIFSSKLV